MTILCVYEYTFLNEVVIKIVAVQNVSSLLQEESKFSNITRAVSSFVLFLKHSVKSDAALPCISDIMFF